MTLQSEKIDQKEYLKRYLSGTSDDKKKKRKKVTSRVKMLKIIDDDLDLKSMRSVTSDDVDLYQLSEDAPVIAGIVDERPMELQQADKYNSKRWKVVTGGDTSDIEIEDRQKSDCQVLNKSTKAAKCLPCDFSTRKSKKQKQCLEPNNLLHKHTNESRQDDEDSSPRGKKRLKQNSDSDSSPQRPTPASRNRSSNNSDLSLHRKLIKDRDTAKHKGRISDLSPLRKSKHTKSSGGHKSQDKSDSDLSPPRREEKQSSRYKSQDKSDSDLSPPRRKEKQSSRYKSQDKSDSDLSPPRKRTGNADKMKKTLDGKQAGLQNAKQLVRENQEFKRREDEMFRQMRESVSGVNASTVQRDRKTGRVRDLEQEARDARKKEEANAAHKGTYDKWGRGMKQGEDMQVRRQQDLHEMSKPLARYRDDEDLERDQKNILRAEDPMLAYMQSKREKTQADLKPKYKGSWAPNRFNIAPGYRWDGVDRSSGYEKSYFMNKNAKKAVEEEAYHWGVSDM